MQALVDSANQDSQFRADGAATSLTTSLTLLLEEDGKTWTVQFVDGRLPSSIPVTAVSFLISGQAEWWRAVFNNRIDAFMATQQGKLKLQRGELAQLSRWYKPFQRAFAIWQTIPIQ